MRGQEKKRETIRDLIAACRLKCYNQTRWFVLRVLQLTSQQCWKPNKVARETSEPERGHPSHATQMNKNTQYLVVIATKHIHRRNGNSVKAHRIATMREKFASNVTTELRPGLWSATVAAKVKIQVSRLKTQVPMNSKTTLASNLSPFSLQNSPQHVSAIIDTKLQHLLRISIILNKERNVNTLHFNPNPNKNYDEVRRETRLATTTGHLSNLADILVKKFLE